VGFEPKPADPVLVNGYRVPRDTELIADASESGSAPVTFRTGHDVTLWPLKISKVEYLSSRAATAAYVKGDNYKAEAGLKLTFETTGGVDLAKLSPATLALYLDGSQSIPGELYRQMAGDALAVVAGPPESSPSHYVSLPLPQQLGFDDESALLPSEARTFRGYRLLTEYFACPERFMFVGLKDLGEAFKLCKTSCEVVILFSRSVSLFSGALGTANFKLYATPAINLFEKQLGRVTVTPHQHEFHVIPDRTKPLDFEIFRLTDVKAYAKDNKDPQTIAPLYAFSSLLYDWRKALFYTTRLTPRRLSTREQRVRRADDYVGTETWISLSAPDRPEILEDVRELAIKALVTNREWPEHLNFRGDRHFNVSGVPADKVSILCAPTKPRPPMGLNDSAWRVIGHLTPNYATLIDQPNGDPSLLKDHLSLYGRPEDAGSRKQVDGIVTINSRMITRRIPGQDRTSMARGHHIRIKLDDASFERGRMFVFSAVLERFLAEFVSINTFTECAFETPLEGLFIQWPARIGRQHNI
jgi:type VI secretion system protein ImpG